MSRLIYIDSNTYIDFIEDRQDRYRSYGEVARQIFRRGLDCEFKVILSPLVMQEVENNSYGGDFAELLNSLQEAAKIVETRFTEEDERCARELSILRKTPYKDTCHAVIAARMKADFLITRNLKDFQNLSDIINIISPDYF